MGVMITANRYDSVKSIVYPAIVSVTTIGATIGGNAFVLGNQMDKLEHGMQLRMDKLENGLQLRIDKLETRMKKLEHEMGLISWQQERLKDMAKTWVADCAKLKK